jgi:hypothetical protein
MEAEPFAYGLAVGGKSPDRLNAFVVGQAVPPGGAACRSGFTGLLPRAVSVNMDLF